MLKHSTSSLNVLPLPLYFLIDDENELQRHVKNDPYIDFALYINCLITVGLFVSHPS